MRARYTAQMTLEILYRDSHLVAVRKPAGMLVHRSAIDAHASVNLLDALRAQLRQPLWLLHRLDKPVGGVLLLALDEDTARAMTRQFEQGGVRKRYLAIVRGHTAERGVIEHALREVRDAITDARMRDGKAPQPAITQYERAATAEVDAPVGRYATARFSLLRLSPLTGRRHQLRRHLKHIAHPILGDTTHGDGRQNTFARERLGCEGLMLCATALQFQHPEAAHPVCVEAAPPSPFLAVMQRLGWDAQVSAPGR
jgi:tRNA pseudouridine65 synthase